MLSFCHVNAVAAQAKEVGLREELLRQSHHVGREGSRKHRAPDPVRGQVGLHLQHIGVESHRQHTVGLVKDEQLEVIEPQRALQQMIEDATRGADHQLGAGAQRLNLRAVADAAVNGDTPDPGGGSQQFGLFRYLQRELTRGSQDQRLASLLARLDLVQDRQQECSGLAASRARLDHQVSPCEQIGDRPRLYGHQPRPPGAGRRGLGFLRQVGQADGGQGVFRFDKVGRIHVLVERARAGRYRRVSTAFATA